MALQPMQRGYKGFQGQTVAPDKGQPIFNETRTQILQSLSKFSTVGAQIGEAHVQRVIEEDKIQQAARAADDLLVTAKERQGITEDSTVAGQLAYNAIIGQHDTANASNDFIQWYSANADADDETIAAKKKEIFSPLLEKYSTDARTMKQVSLQVQEAQFALAPAQERILQDHRSKKAEEAVRISVGDVLANPKADVAVMIDKEIPARAKAMGMDEFTYKQLLMGEAAARAENGDARMLKELQQRDWSKGSAVLTRAQNSYESFVAKENAVLIGNSMADIESEALSLGVPWATTLRKIQDMNNRFPETYSAERIASLKIQQGNAKKKAAQDLAIQQASSAPLVKESAIPLALNNMYTPKQKQDHVKGMQSQWALKGQQLTAAGYPEAEVNSAIQKQMLDWSRANRTVIPNLKDSMEGVINLNPDDYKDGDLPSYANQGISLIQQMDDSTLGLYFSGEEKTMALNLKSFLQNRTPLSAFKRAYDIRRNPLTVTSEQRKNQVADVQSEVDAKLTSSWYQFGKPEVPEWQRKSIESIVSDEAQTYLYRKGVDTTANAKHASEVVLSRYSQTFNDTLINKTQPELAQSMGLSDPSLVNKSLEAFLLEQAPYIEKELGQKMNADEVQFVVNEYGDTITLQDKNGEQIGGRFLLKDIGELGKKYNQQQLEEMRKGVIYRTKEDKVKAEKANKQAISFFEYYSGSYIGE